MGFMAALEPTIRWQRSTLGPCQKYHYNDSGMGMYDMPYHENNIHAALTFGDAFTLEAANANDMLEWVKSLDFFAIIDIYHSSAVDYADIVLPACTKFECEENVKQLRR